MRIISFYAVFAYAMLLILAQPPLWNYIGCLTDGEPRALQGFHQDGDNSLTIESCVSLCAAQL